ncbi:MAG: nucleotidyl transferase AbiEii/AbiGii toxin family protein [Bdellovibrionales bacterium]|nr:nucleotidyl transferase AbiEii/AbiGii toxin family protein [Bdellovibrionales bacterium]
MTTKEKGTSVRQKITDLATKLDVPFQNIQTAFMIERLVARLVADKNLAKHLVFKGGFVGLRVYNSERYTVDLDALLVKANIESTLTITRKNAEVDLEDGVWFKFEDQMDLATQGEYGGVRQVYRAGIGEVLKNTSKAQIIHFDLGMGDPITPGPHKIEVPSLLPKGEEISWSVYPIETICAEKIHALVAHGNINSRSKDVHDLSVFLPKTDTTILGEALKKCFDFRETEMPESLSKTVKAINTTSLQRGWLTATATVPKERNFNEAFDVVVKAVAKLEKSFK